MRILIVDKDIRWPNYIKRILENIGHQIETVLENSKAYQKIPKTQFDLIFLDSKALKENHSILCELMKKKIISRVIVTSALPNYKDAMYAKRLGAADYIDKIYDYDEIINVVSKNIGTTPINQQFLKRRLREERCP